MVNIHWSVFPSLLFVQSAAFLILGFVLLAFGIEGADRKGHEHSGHGGGGGGGGGGNRTLFIGQRPPRFFMGVPSLYRDLNSGAPSADAMGKKKKNERKEEGKTMKQQAPDLALEVRCDPDVHRLAGRPWPAEGDRPGDYHALSADQRDCVDDYERELKGRMSRLGALFLALAPVSILAGSLHFCLELRHKEDVIDAMEKIEKRLKLPM